MLKRYEELAKPNKQDYTRAEVLMQDEENRQIAVFLGKERALEQASADVERLIRVFKICRRRMVDDGYHTDETEVADAALAQLEGKTAQ